MSYMNKFIKKYWFIIVIILLSIIRFLYSYKLPSFYLYEMGYDDGLMIKLLYSLIKGNYLGAYSVRTLVKGPFFSFILLFAIVYKFSFSSLFTILHILACLYFMFSLKHIVKEKRYLIIIYLFLLFNPATFSQDLFQRLYRNSISITQLLFFIGTVIRIITIKNKKILNNVLLGLFISFMFLTREDNIWVYPTILFLIGYSFYKERKIKTIVISLIPIIILQASLNLVSFINYKYYGIYTYNEIEKSEFNNTYKKILQIKDDDKIHMVSIPKSTIYKLAENTKTFNFSKEEIDLFYSQHEYYEYESTKGEIYNGNIVWQFRYMISQKNKFKSGKESEEYYKRLGEEIDELFENGTFQKEFIMPSMYMAVPTKKDFVELPKKVIETIIYTTTYKNIKTLTKTDDYIYNEKINAYYFAYIDYHDTVSIVKKNPIKYEMLRIIYELTTIILGIISLIVYIKNIKKIDNINIINHLLVISYMLIIGGVAYTHISSFNAIRPLYLANIYMIQSIFIVLNLYRIKDKINIKTSLKKCS